MTTTPTDPFSPAISTAVAAHMNSDHPEDNLLIVQALGDQPTATHATMTGVTAAGAGFSAEVDGETVDVTVAWSGPIVERGDIRAEVVSMYYRACALLGVAPRDSDEH